MKLNTNDIILLYQMFNVNIRTILLTANEEFRTYGRLYTYGLIKRETLYGVKSLRITDKGIKLIQEIEGVKFVINMEQTAQKRRKK